MKILVAASIARSTSYPGCGPDSTYKRIRPCEKQFWSFYCLTILLSPVFDTSEILALIKAIDKSAAIHSLRKLNALYGCVCSLSFNCMYIDCKIKISYNVTVHMTIYFQIMFVLYEHPTKLTTQKKHLRLGFSK